MKILQVGKLVEHANGNIDLQYWVLDGDLPLEEEIKKHRQELIKAAKKAGTYTYYPGKALLTIRGVKNKTVTVGLPYPYCISDGYAQGLTEEDKHKGLEHLLDFPDGIGYLNQIKHTDIGFEVYIEDKE